jgi:hypothetical protein
MTLKLEEQRFAANPHVESPLGHYWKKHMDDWSTEQLDVYERWCAEKGISLPHVIATRLDQIRPQKGVMRSRLKGESVRAYRRAVRAWRKELHGSIRKMRKEKEAIALKTQRWAIWVEQGIPLTDPEAVLWYMKTHLLWQTKKSNPYGSGRYLNSSDLDSVCGGSVPPGIDYSGIYYTLKEEGVQRNRERQRNKRVVAENPPTPAERWDARIKTKLKEAYTEAEFRHRHMLDSEVSVLPATPYNKPYANMNDGKASGYSRRRRKETSVILKVCRDWYRTVFLTGLYKAFGPRTLVLSAHRSADGQRTVVTVFRQPSAHRYAAEMVTGYLARDINGNTIFMEK